MATAYLSLTMTDSEQRRKTKLVQMEVQALHADQVNVATAFLTALEKITDLGVERADIIYKGVTAGFDPTAGSNIDVGATFTGVLYDADGKKAALKIPGIKDALRDGVGGIPITHADVEDVLEFFVQATPFDLLISDGQTIDHWVRGRLDK